MKKLSLITIGAISICFAPHHAVFALNLTLTEFSLSFNKPPEFFNQEPKGICAFVGVCSPGIAFIIPDVNPGLPTPPEPYINDTGFIITGFLATLPKNRPEGQAIFVDGFSDIFSKITISNEKQNLRFTGGKIGLNEIIFADFATEPESNSALFITATTIPEPVTILGTGTALGFGMIFKRHRKTKKNEIPENI